MILAGLGDFRFTVNQNAYDKLDRSSTYTWARNQRFGQHAAAQYVGPGQDTITLKGTIYPEHHKGGLRQIDQIREMSATGEPQQLFFGYDNVGSSKGQWTIENIKESQAIFHTNGQPRKQEFTLELSYYG